jgi:hypothetical protein
MSSELDPARAVAERIARQVSKQPAAANNVFNGETELTIELATMRTMLGELQKRLGQLEARLGSARPTVRTNSSQNAPSVPRTHSPWLAGVNSDISHPSEEKFGVEEATVTELVEFFQNEKQCGIDPSGKPCDHCAMCSSRGF